jgi:hypothetical protein
VVEGRAIGSGTIRQWVTVAALGTTQTLAWGSSYYLPAILADDMAGATGVPRTWVFAAFSAALLLAAVLGPRVGRVIDQRGGSGVLVASNIVLAAGLGGLSLCEVRSARRDRNLRGDVLRGARRLFVTYVVGQIRPVRAVTLCRLDLD